MFISEIRLLILTILVSFWSNASTFLATARPTELTINNGDLKQTGAWFWNNAYKVPITYKFIPNENMPNLKFESKNDVIRKMREVIGKAFKVWEQSGDIRFTEVSDDKFAEIRISFEGERHKTGSGKWCSDNFDGRGNVLAHAFNPRKLEIYNKTIIGPGNRFYDMPKTSQINETFGDLHYDASENWVISYDFDRETVERHRKQNLRNIYATTIHEIGHTIGLPHSKNSSAIMFFSLDHKYTFQEAKLTQDDIEALRELYGQRRNFFRRNWVAFLLAICLILFLVIYDFLKNVKVIANDNTWQSRRGTYGNIVKLYRNLSGLTDYD